MKNRGYWKPTRSPFRKGVVNVDDAGVLEDSIEKAAVVVEVENDMFLAVYMVRRFFRRIFGWIWRKK